MRKKWDKWVQIKSSQVAKFRVPSNVLRLKEEGKSSQVTSCKLLILEKMGKRKGRYKV
jgi:hypothetical protein